MSMASAMAGGVAGMRAQSSKLAGISDNIANSSTYGYKTVESEFSNVVISQGGGSYSAGGVRALTYRDVRGEGSLVPTSNSMDIALQGGGFLPVTTIADAERGDGRYRMLMTRTGGFKPDAAGILRNESGQVLLGWAASPDGKIPDVPRESTGALQPVIIQPTPDASPTRNIKLGVNLPADLTKLSKAGEGEKEVYNLEYYGNLGTTENIEVTFTAQGPAADLAAGVEPSRTNTWIMKMKDKASGKEVANFKIEFGEKGQTTGGKDVVYGSIQKVTALAASAGGVAATYDEKTGIAKVTVDGGVIDVELGKPNGNTGPMTQLASPFSPTRVAKDGSPVGILTGIEVDESGILTASYSTGFVKVLYQVPVVTVPNPDGLKAMSAQTYAVSKESGAFFLWNAGEGPAGSMQGYAREASTTDIAGELTDMIQAQRAFSSNAKIIQTVDEMMQETSNIKR